MNTAMTNKFAVFILTHGRPDRVVTYRTLRKQGYTGDIYIIVDNEDKTIDRYRENYGDEVIVFDKLATSKTFDTGDNFEDRRAVIYARNACWEIARGLGLDSFLQLDDDYTAFYHLFSADLIFNRRYVTNLDRLFDIVTRFLENTPFLSVALAQGGDLWGGGRCTNLKRLWLKRKAMNTFFCITARRFDFVGRVNEDVNTYTSLGNRGGLFGSTFSASIDQGTTQANAGGMTEMYLSEGTYRKTFYTIMYAPSCVKVYGMDYGNPRLHHQIKWDNAVPKIVGEGHRKVTK